MFGHVYAQLGAERLGKKLIAGVLQCKAQATLFSCAGNGCQLPEAIAGKAVVGLAGICRVGAEPGQAQGNATAQSAARFKATIGAYPKKVARVAQSKA